MGKIVTVVNQKGGVGKTTTCVSLVAALREKGQKVLLCDFDPQANATSGMGVDKSLSQGIYDVLLNGIEPEKRVVSTRYGDVLPSSKGLAGAWRSGSTCSGGPWRSWPPAMTTSLSTVPPPWSC